MNSRFMNKLKQTKKKVDLYLINKYDLGLFINISNPIAHRTLLKIFLNPFLRIFGWNLASNIDYKIHPKEINSLTGNYKLLTVNYIKYKLLKTKRKVQLPKLTAKGLIYTTVIRPNESNKVYIEYSRN